MTWEKIKGWLSDVKVISPLLLLLYSGTLVALDSRYLTLTSYAEGTVKQLQREIAELRIRLQYANTEQQRQMIRALIIIKEQQIQEERK